MLNKMKKLACALPLLMIGGMGSAQAYNDCAAGTYTQDISEPTYFTKDVFTVPAMSNWDVLTISAFRTVYHNGVLIYSGEGQTYHFSCEDGYVSVDAPYISNARSYWD
ncbi:MAG: hypothetical protein ABIT83_16960 [Massilia sp.]